MKPGPLRLGWPQWAFVLATVVIVIPIVGYLSGIETFDTWLLRRFELPDLERTLGFRTGYVRVPSPPCCGGDSPVFTITDVVKGSAFDQAGVRPGDIPVAYHGFEISFLLELLRGRERGFIRLHLVPLEAASNDNWRSERVVTITFPPSSRKSPP